MRPTSTKNFDFKEPLIARAPQQQSFWAKLSSANLKPLVFASVIGLAAMTASFAFTKGSDLLADANSSNAPSDYQILEKKIALALPAEPGMRLSETQTTQQAKVTTISSPPTVQSTTPLVPMTETPLYTLPPTSASSSIEPSCTEETVRSGDSLSLIFSRHNISANTLEAVVRVGGKKTLTRLLPGQKFHFCFDEQQHLASMKYGLSELETLVLERAPGGEYTKNTTTREYQRLTAYGGGTIKNSLFLSAKRAGLSEKLTMELAHIFGWDIDFVLDIRSGDEFFVVYEELYLDGELKGTGHIISAEFVNQGKTYQAVRYTDSQDKVDYYTPDGHSMRKAFLRTPVNFSRISSGFNLKRKHPVLHTVRAHKGVDYAAPTGTPVKASGDGKITLRGRKGGYGRTVVIQHGTKYSTLYAHLSSYKSGLKTGSRVRQGQVIGYVGQSGLATGPHLHYEFRVNGVHRNPLTVKLPQADPIAPSEKNRFVELTSPLVREMASLKAAQYAETGRAIQTP